MTLIPDFSENLVPLAVVAQLVRALDCGSKCRGFEPRRSPIFRFSVFFIMARKSEQKPLTETPKPSLWSRLPAEMRGIFLLALAILAFLSLISFAYGYPGKNWLGFIGHTIGWVFHASFGLGSYAICLFLGSIGWTLAFKKSYEHSGLNIFLFSVLLGSFCILLSLLEYQAPTLSNFLGQILYPSLYSQKLRYHLGGALFYFIYKDLPWLNLHHLLNATGILIIFLTTFIASFCFLAKNTSKKVFSWFYNKIRGKKPEEEAPADIIKGVEPTEPALPKAGLKADLLRFVKLRIPEGTPNTSQGNQKNQGSEMLAIQPETNLTARPSLSRKSEIDLPPRLGTAIETKIPTPIISVTTTTESKKEKAIKAQKVHNGDFSHYQLPKPAMLTQAKKVDQTSLKKDLKKQAEVLEETLLSFGIEAKVGQINCGPTINSFEVHPAIGVKVQKIKTLENDIALNMEAKSIRIVAPIPGKAAVGIEVPNPQPQEVGFRDMLNAYQQGQQKYHIPILLGKAVNGDYVMSDLTKMPHCIIAGATGSGKSVCINTIVMSILFNASPDQIKLLMIDPKKVELTPYTHLPHMIAPVITEPHEACGALRWLVKEMETRYEILKLTGVRNIEGFNNRTINKQLEESLKREIPTRMPYIVGIVDELADLMMVASSDIETPIARIAQMARAVGIHLILATQRPSREVITGLIKANFPTRISFKVASRVNSQIILDETGAESLLGNGDMLFLPPGSSQLIRAQGAFIRDDDINSVVKYICDQAPPNYLMQSFDSYAKVEEDGPVSKGESGGNGADSLYDQALDIVLSTNNASTTFLQRKLKIGYARAASLIDELEKNGIVSPPDGSKPRRVLNPKGE